MGRYDVLAGHAVAVVAVACGCGVCVWCPHECIVSADHVAVDLFLTGRYGGLRLHFPCSWDAQRNRFTDNGKRRWWDNPGLSANRYHQKFSASTQKRSFDELFRAQRRGCEIEVHDGFHARNAVVAQSDYLMAFTWSPTDRPPTKGGTHHTWTKCTSQKLHVSLGLLCDSTASNTD